MRKLIVFYTVIWVLVLAGCGPSYSWQVKGTWRIRPIISNSDLGRLDDIGVSRDQAHRYQILVYSVTAFNKSWRKADWVGAEAILHPDFEARIRARFDFGDHPPLMLDARGAGTTGATYLLEGTEEEIVALTEKNRFKLTWFHKEQKMAMDIQLTREQK